MLIRCAPKARLTAAAANTLKAPPASDTTMIQERVLTEFGSFKSRGLYAVASGLLGDWRNDMKVLDLCSWLGAAVANLGSDSRSYREDAQQHQGRKDKLS